MTIQIDETTANVITSIKYKIDSESIGEFKKDLQKIIDDLYQTDEKIKISEIIYDNDGLVLLLEDPIYR